MGKEDWLVDWMMHVLANDANEKATATEIDASK